MEEYTLLEVGLALGLNLLVQVQALVEFVLVVLLAFSCFLTHTDPGHALLHAFVPDLLNLFEELAVGYAGTDHSGVSVHSH